MEDLPGGHQAPSPRLASGRTGRRPAVALDESSDACKGGTFFATERFWETSCSRPGPARRCEPPPSQRMPTLGAQGAKRRRLRPGSPVTTDGHLLCRGWGKPWKNGRPKEQLRKPSQGAQRLRENIPGRRRFAPAQPVRKHGDLEGRRDEHATDVCPWHTRLTEGKTQLPHSLWPPCWRTLPVPRKSALAWCAGYCRWVAPPSRRSLHGIRRRHHLEGRGQGRAAAGTSPGELVTCRKNTGCRAVHHSPTNARPLQCMSLRQVVT